MMRCELFGSPVTVGEGFDRLFPTPRQLENAAIERAGVIPARAEPDGSPSGDLVLRRMAGGLTVRELDRRSDAWRPWRAYAAMLLWQQAGDDGSQFRRTEDVQSAVDSKRRVDEDLRR